MVKLLVFLARNPDMSKAEFRRRLHEEHLPLVRRLPGLRKLAVNTVLVGPDGLAPVWDTVTEGWFENTDALSAALASEEGQTVNADAAGFLDLSKLQMIVVEEED
jgi:uncharacterized protein (TIGR02118 family)